MFLIEDLIGILLIVSPGFIVRRVKDSIVAKEAIKTDVENTIISIIYSIPILFMNLIALKIVYKISEVDHIILRFQNLNFILLYALLTVITTSIFIYFLTVSSPEKMNKILNKIRIESGQPQRTNSVNPWQDFFKVEDNMPIRIIKGGEIVAEGFVKHWDIDGSNDKDIVLEYEVIFKENPNCFKRVKNTYYNIINDVVIQELYFDQEFLDNN